MAGIIDIRFNLKEKRWTAQPRFAYDAQSYQNGAAIGIGRFPDMALYDLCEKVPLNIANQIRIHMHNRTYASPERELGEIHKCLDLDGHRPTPDEFRRRHADYITEKKLGRDYRSVHY